MNGLLSEIKKYCAARNLGFIFRNKKYRSPSNFSTFNVSALKLNLKYNAYIEEATPPVQKRLIADTAFSSKLLLFAFRRAVGDLFPLCVFSWFLLARAFVFN